MNLGFLSKNQIFSNTVIIYIISCTYDWLVKMSPIRKDYKIKRWNKAHFFADPLQSLPCVLRFKEKRLSNKSTQGDVCSEWSGQWSIDCKVWPAVTEQTGPDSLVVITPPFTEGHSLGTDSNIHFLPTVQLKKMKVQLQNLGNIRDRQYAGLCQYPTLALVKISFSFINVTGRAFSIKVKYSNIWTSNIPSIL